MRYIILLFSIITALNVKAHNEMSDFLQKKSKLQNDATETFSKEIIAAQKAYEKALIDADKKYQETLSELDKQHEVLLEKTKELPKVENVAQAAKATNTDATTIKKRSDGGESATTISNSYTVTQLDAIIAAMGLPKSTGTKVQKVELIIKNA